jgi:LysR family transcriptional regulator, cyn operon transcriptional activator
MTSDEIELRHLRYFLVVAETENFTRAAERLRITQPSVSQQIAHLEHALGTPLFRRIGKRVWLTEAGAAFRKGAEMVMRKLEDACASVHDVSGLVTGHVEVGVIPALNVAWLPPALQRVSRDYPGITVGVQERPSSGVETELEAGRLDLGLGIMTRNSPNIRYEPLVSEPFSLLVSVEHELASRVAIDPSELEGVRFVLLPSSFDMRRAGDEIFRRARTRPRVVFEIGNIDSVLSSVVSSRAATVLPAIVLRGRDALGLRAIPLNGKGRRMEFGLLWPAASSASPAARAVAASLKSALKEGGAPLKSRAERR